VTEPFANASQKWWHCGRVPRAGASASTTTLAVVATALLAVVVCVVSGASEPTSIATRHAPVVKIEVSSLPESPVLEWSPDRPGWDAVVASLPSLPPSGAAQSCTSGPVLTLQFGDGSSTTYACALPTAIRRLRDQLIARAPGTATTSAPPAETSPRRP
jgi:hypothetical protein